MKILVFQSLINLNGNTDDTNDNNRNLATRTVIIIIIVLSYKSFDIPDG